MNNKSKINHKYTRTFNMPHLVAGDPGTKSAIVVPDKYTPTVPGRTCDSSAANLKGCMCKHFSLCIHLLFMFMYAFIVVNHCCCHLPAAEWCKCTV